MRVNSAAVVAEDESEPMVVTKGEVVTADPGLTIPPKIIIMSDTREVLAKALLIVTVSPLTEQVTPATGAPLILTSMHVAPATFALPYCPGNTTVAVALVASGVLAQGVVLSRSSYIRSSENV